MRSYIFPIISILTLGTASLSAADIYLADSNSDSPPEDWNTLSEWNTASDGTGVAPGSISASDDYFINSFTLRTPDASATFGGNSLSIDGNGALLIRHLNGNASTVNDLVLGGGNLNAGRAFQQTINAVNVSSTDFTRLTALSDRGITFNITNLTGNSVIKFGDASNETGLYQISIANATGFTGELQSVRGTTDFQNDVNLGNASWFLNENAMTGVVLDQSITFSAVVFAGAGNLGAGTYSASDLNTFATTTKFSGGGQLTIIPEPSSYSLGIALIALASSFATRRFGRKS
jgi:hypothetical protein